MKLPQKNTNLLLFSLAVLTAVSSAGSSVTLIALSSDLLNSTGENKTSAYIQTMAYIGAAFVGVFGGYFVQKFTRTQVGFWSPLLGSLISLYLYFSSPVSPTVGLLSIFLLFVLSGLETPNYISFLNSIIPEHSKIRSFSTVQSLNTAIELATPALAGLVIAFYGSKICYLFDSLTYALTCIPWIFLRRHAPDVIIMKRQPDIFIGFKIIFKDKFLLRLNMSRLLNNISYVTFGTCIPIWIGNVVKNNEVLFSKNLGIAHSSLSLGFLCSSLFGLSGLIKNSNISRITWITSGFAFLGVIIGFISTDVIGVFAGCTIVGFAQFFFRISGITIGQYYTQKEDLAPVIIAGDGMVRLYSAGVSAMAILMLSNSSPLFIVSICSLTLLAPFVLRPLVNGMRQ